MVVGVDARELEGKSTGVGIYLRNILERIRIPAGAELQLYFKNEIPSSVSEVNALKILLRSGSRNPFWQQWTLRNELARRKVKLFFSPAAAAPWYFGGIQVLTIHDLSFFRFPQWFSTKQRISRQINTAYSLHHADRIYAVSPFVRAELMERFRIPAGRILVTCNGVTKKTIDPSMRQLLKQSYGLQNVTIVLYVGSIFNRRHLPVLIKALRSSQSECILVIIGENRTFPHQDLAAIAQGAEVSGRVRLLEYVPEKVLEDYYRMSDLFVYLSEYEGFGIPPLEAMSYGIPVILSDTPAMNEIFREAAYFVKSISAVEVGLAMDRCLSDSPLRERLIQAGKALADRYSWEETARIMSEDWEHLLAARS